MVVLSRIIACCLFAAVLLAGSPVMAQRPCTMIGCVSGLTVNFIGDYWPHGNYEFRIRADGVSYNCKASLPIKSCESSGVSCDREGVIIGESGCALPPEAHSFYGLSMETTIPSEISIEIRHESGKTLQFDEKVKAFCSYPNGKECDPEPCCSASLEEKIIWE